MQRSFHFENYVRNEASKTIELISAMEIVDNLDRFIALGDRKALTNAKKLMKAKHSPVLRMDKNVLLEKLKTLPRYKDKLEIDNRVTQIQRIFNNILYDRVRPFVFVGGIFKPFGVVLFPTGVQPPRGGGDLFFSESLSDFVRPHARIGKLEDTLYNPRRLPVHYQPVMVVGGFAVADRVKGSAVKPRLCPRPNGRTDFPRIIPAVKFVYDILQCGNIVVLAGGIHAVVDGDIPHILHREITGANPLSSIR